LFGDRSSLEATTCSYKCNEDENCGDIGDSESDDDDGDDDDSVWL
jgi:hypothetical protein